MKDLGFTDIQIQKIQELIQRLHKVNTDLGSDRKIEGVEFFRDKRRTFMCSYAELCYEDGTFRGIIHYDMITPDGKVIDAIEYYGDDVKCNEICSRMEKIKL